MKPITQKEPMGCAIACVASILETSYTAAKKKFKNPKFARTRGYYCGEICEALKSARRDYSYCKYSEKKKDILNNNGTIVFIEKSGKYPEGHFLVKSEKGWMNPWINCPVIIPAKSGFSKKLPGKAEWIVHPTNV